MQFTVHKLSISENRPCRSLTCTADTNYGSLYGSLNSQLCNLSPNPVADAGFPVGGRGPRRGVDSWGGYVSKILYVKTKESGPLGPVDPPMQP